MNEFPQSWAPNYVLPTRTINDVDVEDRCPYQSLIESLFHMDDAEAEKIKAQYLLAYPFMDKDRIKNW